MRSCRSWRFPWRRAAPPRLPDWGLHRRGLAAPRRGGEVAAALTTAITLVAAADAVLDERRAAAALAVNLGHASPPHPELQGRALTRYLSYVKCL